MNLIVVILLILLIFGGLPQTGWHQYGYGPSGGLGTVLIIIVILMLLGRL
jgi:hypothetical protein